MRLATIDLGSNTVRLLVADVADERLTVVDQDQRVTRLGEGLTRSWRLGEAPAARTADVVVDYVARARAAGAVRVRVVATSAVREAANGAEFAATLERRAGIPVEVVSGQEEARLTLQGIVYGLGGSAPGTLVTFDVGGGSTEYVVARHGALVEAVSLRLGVVPLAERHPLRGPASAAALAALRADVAATLDAALPRRIGSVRPDVLVGSAGTITTLAALDLVLRVYDAARVQGHVLSRAAVERQAARLAALDVAGRAALPCLEPGRADLILPGVAIVLETMTRFAVDRVTVSDFGLREGLLLDAAAPRA